MQKQLYSRKANVITDLNSGQAITYKSINEAKRESRKVQKSFGGLGMGSLRVIPHSTKRDVPAIAPRKQPVVIKKHTKIDLNANVE